MISSLITSPTHIPNLGVAVRVLVAGDRSHIGVVLIPFLRVVGHEVDGLDPRLCEGCDPDPAPANALATSMRRMIVIPARGAYGS